ncbi:MAG: 2OG-Fe(II) oxygenase [Pirellulales bacterium]
MSTVDVTLPGIRPIDWTALRDKVCASKPVPNFCIDGFLEPEFAREVAETFPSYEYAMRNGKTHETKFEHGKYQLTDVSVFPAPIAKLNEVLASQPFLDALSTTMDIPRLLADPTLEGGGLHQTGPRGKLGVHVDFNYHEQLRLHRRLNILIYLNPAWRAEWGGNIELWDAEVNTCHHAFAPVFNRCVVFETNEVSFHGVSAIECPDDQVRRSFAAYYYTQEAPAHWTGTAHSTIFRKRPSERNEPALSNFQRIRRALGKVKRKILGDN